VDEWQMQSNEEAGIRIVQHRTLDDRFAQARAASEHLGLTMPVLVDDMSNSASEAFAAWPERIYVIGPDGRIAYKGGPGPWEFDPAEARRALDDLLCRQ
jgi:Iodothyronine deiodinase